MPFLRYFLIVGLMLTLGSAARAGEGEALRLHEQVKLYPNPSYDGMVSLEIPSLVSSPHITVEVYNMIGEQVLVIDYQEFQPVVHELDLSVEPKGTYFIRVIQGADQVTRRITLK